MWIVDDSPLEAELVRRSLVDFFAVEVFHDGAALLEQMSVKSPPDILVVDWQMPGMSGLEICHYLRGQPATESIAILILTAQQETRDLVEGLAAGADDFLSKPFVTAELVARVTSLVRSKRLRDRTERAERSVRAMLMHLPDAIVSIADDATITFVNQEAEWMLGATSDQLVGQSARDWLPVEVIAPAAQSDFADVEIRGMTYAPALRKFAESDTTETTISFRNVTAQRRLDEERTQLLARERAARTEAEAANRAKDEFLAVVSHELRTPLNAVLGWARLLRLGHVREDKRERALETIERNATAQAKLIDDILDVSRIISGKVRLAVAPVTLAQVVEGAMEGVRPGALAKNIRIDSEIDPEIPAIEADVDRLRQVIWDLLSNAVKFSSPGSRVLVTLRRAGALVEIEVADEGTGIALDFLPYVFDRFRQAEGGTSRAHGGLGLGLAIVRHLVEMHGGSVEARSQGVGRGASFFVRLPVGTTAVTAPASNTELAATLREVATTARADLTGLRVLVLEDNDDTRELLAVVLRDAGAEVELASAAAALDIVGAAEPNVILSDIGLPGEDGYAFIVKLRKLTARNGTKIHAVALTAFAGDDDRRRTIGAGFDAFVAKPFDPAELTHVVAGLARQA